METKAILEKPYTEQERLDFIVEYNHNLGYEIKEAETALEAWGDTEEELAYKEKERVGKLFLTAADVERGIYKAKKITFEMLISQLQDNEEIDIEELKIELKANHFYRGNPYVSMIGSILGFTEEQLDKFFEDGNYEHLL